MLNRTEAKQLGHKRYQGKSCKLGHDGVRYVSTRTCCACGDMRNHSEENKAARAKYMPKFKEKNPGYFAMKASERRRELALRSFSHDTEAVLDFYNKRPEGLEVDHDVPINGVNVCGLHVSWNLQYLTPLANRKKFNSYG